MKERRPYRLRFLYKGLNLSDEELKKHHLKALADKIKSKTNDDLQVLDYLIPESHLELTIVSHLSRIIIKDFNYSKMGAYKKINRYIKDNNIKHIYYDIYGSKVYRKSDFKDLI